MEQIYIYRGGRPALAGQPTVLFLHGAGHDHSVWAQQSRYLAARGYTVLAPDLPGHGRSTAAPLASIETLAAWVQGLIEGLGPVVLIGHSMGALIALEVAATAPTQVHKLALIGAVAPLPVAPALLAAARDELDAAHRMINEWSFAPASRLGASALPGFSLAALNERLLQRQAPGVLHRDLAACNAYTEGLSVATQVRSPTLLLSAAQDRMAPPRASAPLAAALATHAAVHSVILPGAGHAMMSEAPGAVRAALIEFITGPPG